MAFETDPSWNCGLIFAARLGRAFWTWTSATWAAAAVRARCMAEAPRGPPKLDAARAMRRASAQEAAMADLRSERDALRALLQARDKALALAQRQLATALLRWTILRAPDQQV